MKRIEAGLLAAAIVGGGLLGGCDKGTDQRSSVEFHVGGVLKQLERLRREVPRRDKFSMEDTVAGVERAISGLPGRIKKKATSRVQERVALAEEIVKDYRKLRPYLEKMRYEEGKANTEIDKLVEKVKQLSQP